MSSRGGGSADVDASDAQSSSRTHAQPSDGQPLRSVGFTLSSLGYAVSRRFRQTLAPLSLEPREFALLRSVREAEGESQNTIGERLQIPPSRMVAFVDALEQRGLLERRQNPQDRRARALYLTQAGREMHDSAMAVAFEFERELTGDLSAAEREQLLDLLARVGTALDLPPGVHDAHRHPALRDAGKLAGADC